MGAPRYPASSDAISVDQFRGGQGGTAPSASGTADDAISVEQFRETPPPERKAWENVGGDEPGGEAKNVKTAATKGVLGFAGAIGDLEHLAESIKAGIQSIPSLWNKDAPDTKTILARKKAEADKAQAEKLENFLQQEKPWGIGQARWDAMQKRARETGKLPTPISNVATTEGLYQQYVAPHVGEYKPQTTEGKVGAAAVQAGVGFLTPGSKVQTAERIIEKAPSLMRRAGVSVPEGLAPAARFVEPFAPNVRAGGLSIAGGVGAERIAEYYPDNPNLPLVMGFAGPAAAEGALWGGKRYIGPQTKEGQYRKAAGQMAEDIKKSDAGPDPVQRAYERGQQTLDDLPEWQQGDKKIQPGLAEATESSGLALSELVTQQDPRGGPALKQKKAARDEAHEKVLGEQVDQATTGKEVETGLTQRAKDLEDQINKAIPDPGAAEAVGAGVRGKLTQARTIAGDLRNKLYDYLETTFGQQTLQIGGLKQTATDLMKHTEGFETPKATNKSIDLALQMPGEVSFSQLRVYLKDLNKKIDDMRGVAGMGSEKARLEQLRAAVWNDMHGAVKNRLESQFGPEPRGPNAEAAFQAQLERETRDWQAGRGVGPKDPMSLPAIQALKDANAAQKLYGETFKEGTVGALLKENRFAQAWNVVDSAVPRKAFPGGPDGYGITKAVLDASPDTLPMIKQAAIMSLREEMAKNKGVLTPDAVAKWRNTYAKSLTAIDEAEVAAGRPKFSDQFNNLSNAQSKLAQSFIGAVSIEEARAKMGALLGARGTGPSQVAALIQEAGQHGPMVQEGLKKLMLDFMIERAGEKGDFGQRLSNSLRMGQPILRQLFGDEHLQVMQSLMDDAARQREHSGRMAPGVANSDTARRQKLIEQRMADVQPLGVRDMMQGIMGGGVGGGLMWLSGLERSPGMALGSAALGVGTIIMSRLKARGINGTNDAYRAGLLDPQLGLRMLKFAAEGPGSPQWWKSFDTALRMSPYFVPLTQQNTRNELDIDKKARQGRAAGGRANYKFDCASRASKLCREAELIRKRHAGGTKQLLNVSDDEIADALRVAGGRI